MLQRRPTCSYSRNITYINTGILIKVCRDVLRTLLLRENITAKIPDRCFSKAGSLNSSRLNHFSWPAPTNRDRREKPF